MDQFFAQEDLTHEIQDPARVLWLVQDNLGSVRDVIDNEGDVVNRIDYDAFGNILSVIDPSDDDQETDLLTNVAFTGQMWDADLGLYYYKARWYDAVVGKFISRDPLGFEAGDANLYRYVFNSPVNWTDPSGRLVPLLAGSAAFCVYWFWPDTANAPAPGEKGRPSDPHGGLLWAAGTGAVVGGGLLAIGPAGRVIGGTFCRTGAGGALGAALTRSDVQRLVQSSGDRVATVFTRLSSQPAADRYLHTAMNPQLCNQLQNTQATQMFVGRIPADLFNRMLLEGHIYLQMVEMGCVRDHAYVFTPQAMEILHRYFQATGGSTLP